MKVLLVEPGYRTKFPSMGLMKISTFHKRKGDQVEYVKGENMYVTKPDRIYVTSIFTYDYHHIRRSIQFYRNLHTKVSIWLGGLAATLIPEYFKDLGIDHIQKGLWDDVEDEELDYSLHPDIDVTIMFTHRGCIRKCSWCLSPSTKILYPDLTQKPISDVNIGDTIVGLKQTGSSKHNYIMRHATVTGKKSIQTKAYKIKFSNGEEVVCSGDHRWLTKFRGWKYTTAAKRPEQRPYLTYNNEIKYIPYLNQHINKSKEYMMGYIDGSISGDGYCARTPGKHEARLSFTNTNKKYIDYMLNIMGKTGYKNIHFRIMRHPCEEHPKTLYCIYTGVVKNFELFYQLRSKYSSNKEYKRGYVAGIFDSEGSGTYNYIRIFNKNKEIISKTIDILKLFDFKIVLEPKNEMFSIRISGGIAERIRFVKTFNPLIGYKRAGIIMGHGTPLHLTPISIKPIGEMELIDIETTTENFIANGLVSHNCCVHIHEPRFTPKQSIERYIKGFDKISCWDNNTLANPQLEYVVDVFEKAGKEVDFNQSLDIRLLTKKKAKLLKRLKIYPLRFAFDDISYKDEFMEGVEICKEVGLKQETRVDVLYNFEDTPEDFYERLSLVLNSGWMAYPMRYKPIFQPDKEFLGKRWTLQELNRYDNFCKQMLGRVGDFINPRSYVYLDGKRMKLKEVISKRLLDIPSKSQQRRYMNQQKGKVDDQIEMF